MILFYQRNQFGSGDISNSSAFILFVHPFFNVEDKRVFFGNHRFFRIAVILVQPVSDTGNAGSIVNGNERRTVEQFPGVKNIVYFFVF